MMFFARKKGLGKRHFSLRLKIINKAVLCKCDYNLFIHSVSLIHSGYE